MKKMKIIEAGDGKLFRRKRDGFIMGEKIHLGNEDAAANYEEVPVPINRMVDPPGFIDDHCSYKKERK